MIPERKIDMCTVHGMSHTQPPRGVDFTLTNFEVKHIRRCIRLYHIIHPVIVEGATVDHEALLKKWEMFGRIKFRMHSSELKNKLKDAPRQCSIPGCTRTNLTIDHIIPNSTLNGHNGKENLQYLCRQHHDIKELNYRIDWKVKEIEILKAEILKKESEL